METITKKTTLIEFEGKKHMLPDDITLGEFLVMLGLPEETSVRMVTTKEGFLLVPQIVKNLQ